MSTAPKLSSALIVTAEIVRGPNQGQKLTFQQEKWTAGRGPENDLVLAQDLKVSRNHIEVQVTSNQVFIRNISQKNIMMVDGLLAVENIMKSDSVVQIGETFIRFKFDRPADRPIAPQPAAAQPVAQLKAVPPLSENSQLSGVPATFGNAVTTGAGHALQPKAGGGIANPTAFGNGGLTDFSNGGNLGLPKTPPPMVELPLVSHPKFRFYAMVVVLGIGFLWFLNSESGKKKADEKLRDSVVVTEDLEKSKSEVQRIQEDEKSRGVDTPQFRLAEAQFIKGFRDYQQGQYARAMEAFQSARSFYPNHELATKYFNLARRKYDEKVQMYMQQGQRYRGSQNWRLCESSFATAIVLIKDDRNPVYQEAKQLFDECRTQRMRK